MINVLKLCSNFLKTNTVLILFFIFAGYLVYAFICPAFFIDPIIQDDYALHYANAIETVKHILARGVSWGYSPEYCGGRLSFGIDDIWSSIFLLLFASFIGNTIAFNVSIIVGFMIPPLSIFLFLKNSGCSKSSIATGCVLTMLAVNGMVPLRSFYYTGCYGFVVGTALCFLLAGILNNWIWKNNNLSLLLITVIGTLCISIHPLSALTFLMLALPLITVNLKVMKTQQLLHISVAGLIAAGFNLVWLVPFFRYGKGVDHVAVTGMQTHTSYLYEVLTGNKAFLVLSLLYLISLWIFYKKKQWKDFTIWGVASLGYSIIGFFGSQLGLGDIEPNRFIIPLIFSMITAVSSLSTEIVSGKNIPRLVLIICFIILILKPLPAYTFGLNKYPEATEILSLLKKTDDDQGRILLQDSYEHPYFDSHFSALLPLYTGRETTASTYRLMPPVYPQFVEDRLFGTSLSEISTQQLNDLLSLYNIRYILVYSTVARTYFDSCDLVEPVKYIGMYSIYSVKEFHYNLCYDCTAKVTANNHGISVENESDTITVLKYHYFKTLKVLPDSITIEPVFLLNDPSPFIRIRNRGVHQFKIVCK